MLYGNTIEKLDVYPTHIKLWDLEQYKLKNMLVYLSLTMILQGFYLVHPILEKIYYVIKLTSIIEQQEVYGCILLFNYTKYMCPLCVHLYYFYKYS